MRKFSQHLACVALVLGAAAAAPHKKKLEASDPLAFLSESEQASLFSNPSDDLFSSIGSGGGIPIGGGSGGGGGGGGGSGGSGFPFGPGGGIPVPTDGQGPSGSHGGSHGGTHSGNGGGVSSFTDYLLTNPQHVRQPILLTFMVLLAMI